MWFSISLIPQQPPQIVMKMMEGWSGKHDLWKHPKMVLMKNASIEFS